MEERGVSNREKKLEVEEMGKLGVIGKLVVEKWENKE